MTTTKEIPRAGQATGDNRTQRQAMPSMAGKSSGETFGFDDPLPVPGTRSQHQGLDVSKLENVVHSNGKTTARCPACAEQGGDTKGDHLAIYADGRFGCVMYPGEEGRQHRSRIFELVRLVEKRPVGKSKKVHATMNDAVKAAPWSLTQKSGTAWTETRRDLYHDAKGQVVACVLRFDRADGARDKNGKPVKEFRPVHRVAAGWMTGDPPGHWPLFRLHEVNANPGPVFVVEGEKAAAAGVEAGLNCTTSAHGSKSPHKTDWTPLAGREVVILPDNDGAGRTYAEKVASMLVGLTPPAKVKTIRLPGLPAAGDLADFIKLRDDAAAMVRTLAMEAMPEQVEPSEQTPPVPDTAKREQTNEERAARDQYGDPVFWNDNGSLTMNESFWAGLYAAENIILHEPSEREFYRYEPSRGLYVVHTSDRIKTEIAARIFRAGEDWKMPDLVRCRRDSALNAMVNHLRGQTEHRDAFAKRDHRFVHLANGIIWFRDNDADFVEFSPMFRSRNQSPVAYAPEATCERFLNELLLPAVHADDAILVQKFAGLYLLGENIIQRFLILDGTPEGGKTQLVIVLQHLVGLANCTQLRTEHLSERFEIFRFLKKTLLVGSDVQADFLNTKGAYAIKSLVGGDIMDAERKGHSGSFPVEGRFNVVVTANTRLRVKLEGDIGAWRRRTTIVRYENPPPKKRIPDFGKVLMDTEGPGILNWALEGLRLLLQDVAEIGDIRLTDRQRKVVDSLLAESDSLRVFLMERVETMPGCSLAVNELVEEYAVFCPAKGWNPLPITIVQRQLEGLMLELFRVTKSGSCGQSGTLKGYRGVRFRGNDLL